MVAFRVKIAYMMEAWDRKVINIEEYDDLASNLAFKINLDMAATYKDSQVNIEVTNLALDINLGSGSFNSANY